MPYTREEIFEIANWKYLLSRDVITFCDLYVINGIPYTHEKVDSVLSGIPREDVGILTFVKNSFSHRDCDVITVIRSQVQTRDEKREVLEEFKDKFNNFVNDGVIIHGFICSECPLVIINDVPFHSPYKAKSVLNDISIDSIKSIYYDTRMLNLAMYGYIGSNGVLDIKMKSTN